MSRQRHLQVLADGVDGLWRNVNQMQENSFICPECGGTQCDIIAMVSTVPIPDNPWSGVLEQMTCAQCDFVIPAHLAQRWEGISREQAQREWQEVYRATAWKSSDEEEADDE